MDTPRYSRKTCRHNTDSPSIAEYCESESCAMDGAPGTQVPASSGKTALLPELGPSKPWRALTANWHKAFGPKQLPGRYALIFVALSPFLSALPVESYEASGEHAKVGLPALIVDPGKAVASLNESGFSLGNNAFQVEWALEKGHFKFLRFQDFTGGRGEVGLEQVFSLIFKDGSGLVAADMTLAAPPKVEDLAGNPGASKQSEKCGGKKIALRLLAPAKNLEVQWHGVLRDGSNYLRQEITLLALDKDLAVSDVQVIQARIPEAKISGSVKGSPAVSKGLFAACEHPLSDTEVSKDKVICRVLRKLPLPAGHSVQYSSVIGVTAPGQLRRGFLNYVERERAHPYRPFLHYNSWYDIGYFSKFDEALALNRVVTFGQELSQRRGVTLDSFLFDDGWDDPKTLWQFNAGFPKGFAPLTTAASKIGAAPGVWLSPWGGYGKPKEERLKHGKAQGFESNAGGFALSGPKYYPFFRQICLEMIQKYGLNQFKIDGTGNADQVIPGSSFDSDFDAAIHLIQDLRAAQPSLFVNLTTGTFPSPFWLFYADSIWRGGDDHDFAGVGSWRQKWITYRDADTYKNVVQSGPLFPLNALMLHGLIYAQHAKNLQTDPGKDFKDEVRSYFGTGTQLQEMYITPALLTQEDWDVLAEAAKWSRKNASVLRDTHWVGGNPGQLQVYGWAAWNPEKAVLVLRNPSDKPQQIELDLGQTFEIPLGTVTTDFLGKSPWDPQVQMSFSTKKPAVFSLNPFQVLVLELMPVLDKVGRRSSQLRN